MPPIADNPPCTEHAIDERPATPESDSAPTYLEQTRSYTVLMTSYLIIGLALTSGLVLLVLYPKWFIALIWFGLTGFAVLVLLVLRSGRETLATWLMVVGLWLIAATGTVFFSGVHSTSYLHLLVVIVLAGLVLGARAGVATSVITMVWGAGLLLAESQSWLPDSLIEISSQDIYLGQAQVAVAAALFIGIAGRAFDRALAKATRAEQELARANEALREEMAERETEQKQRERAEQALAQSHKMEAIGRLAGGMAHDTNNVLTVVLGQASLLLDELDERDPHREAVEQVLSAGLRGRDTVRSLLGLARKGRCEREQVSVCKVTRSVAAMLERTLPRKVQLVRQESCDQLTILGDESQLSTALLNLCFNAVHAMEEDGTLTISCSESAASSEGERLFARIAVSDTGCGMSDEVQRQAFEPYFTTKAEGEGSGLGLAMVYGTVATHGGTVHIDSEPGVGTTVTILLPAVRVAAVPAASPSPEATAQTPATRDGAILIVDDEPLVRRLGIRLIERMGLRALTAGGGAEAIELVREHGSTIHLVVLDMRMPEMDGRETYAALRELRPTLPVLICTGEVESAHTEELLEQGAAGVLSKPFEASGFAETVRGLLLPAPTSPSS